MSDKLNNNKILMYEWDFEKNKGVDPNDFLEGSSKEVYWKCSKCGYSWKKRIVDRFKGKGCPVCANRITVQGINDLCTKYPDVAAEWDYSLNKEDPHSINCHCLKEANWICKKGHRWKCSINYRTYGKTGCPVCANLVIVEGYNDLASRCPKLTKEWDYELNEKKPQEICFYGKYKAHWISEKGHKWVASVESRYRGNGCPKCSKELRISFPEKAIYFYIKDAYKKVIENYKPTFLKGKEIDIYIPKINVGIEYDGVFWHKDFVKDLEKDNLCYQNGVELYRIRENGCKDYQSPAHKISLSDNNYKGLDKAIKTLFKFIYNKKIDINTKRDQINIEQLIDRNEKKRSILETNPEIAKMWDKEKNGKLKPDNYRAGSHVEVYWKCPKCKNSFKREIRAMIDKNGKCPICLKQKIVPGINDFATNHPYLLKELDYEKNVGINPKEINQNNDRHVWWKCAKGHSYQQTIYARTKMKQGCPYCSGIYAIKGENDLLTTNPEIKQFWDYEKNEDKPEDFKAGSHKLVWWKCPKGHSYQKGIREQIKYGCSMCKKNK